MHRNPSATSCAPGGPVTTVAIEGELIVRLDCAARRVRQVTVRSTRPMIAARLLAGRTPADAAGMVRRLFSICSGAQGAAAAAALAAAGATGRMPEPGYRDREVMLEALQDTFWHLLIDWPNTMGQAPCATPVAAARFQIASSMRTTDGTLRPLDRTALRALGERLSAIAAQTVFGMPPATWLEFDDVEKLQAWCTRGETVPAALGPGAGRTADAGSQRNAAHAGATVRVATAHRRARDAR
jgi:Ni,Fe-hydrogenase I large subunit